MDGAILLSPGTVSPAALLLQPDSFLPGWGVVKNARANVETDMTGVGWNLFFLAGEMKATATGFGEEKTLPAALRRFGAMAQRLKCNGFEITRVTRSLFLGLTRVTVTGHARHLQKGGQFLGKRS
jgi:hypothetical protein